ncbi:hypothetical protein ACL7TT_15845 [Microbulbifer sp. 2304DJ12-6]|uniref:hypothetical protein n=1 Tax=Microbulbifer sp. 2304DJ12-6 TaxID=3233340 RepID=UPI0039AEBDB9
MNSFVTDHPGNSHQFWALNISDDYSKELIGQRAAFSVTGAMAGRLPDQHIEDSSLPDQITCGNNTGFSSQAMLLWQQPS